MGAIDKKKKKKKSTPKTKKKKIFSKKKIFFLMMKSEMEKKFLGSNLPPVQPTNLMRSARAWKTPKGGARPHIIEHAKGGAGTR